MNILNIKFFLSLLLIVFVTYVSFAQEKLESQKESYTKAITDRADKIVNSMEFANDTVKSQVRDMIVEHYRFLNNAEETRDEDVAEIRKEFAQNTELHDAKFELRKAKQEIDIRDHHFAFLAQLKQIISENQIDEVKDGLTYGVLKVTYESYCDMIPALKEEEKTQIMIWLVEAREHAIDGGTSKEKHAWFGKYKGRINNYLSDSGYDLQKEREQWEKRLKDQKDQ